MFKKVQLKFFGIIVSILLAIFIAVLGSINLIMDYLTERQSKNVLEKIAAGVEYDEKTSTFTFKRDFDRMGENFNGNFPPDKQNSEPAPVTTAVTTTEIITTITETTETITEAVTETQPQTTQEPTEEITQPEEEQEEPQENHDEEEPPPPPDEEKTETPPEKPTSPPTENIIEEHQENHDDDDDEDDEDDDDDDDEDDDFPPFPDDDFNPFDPNRPNQPERPDDWGNPWDNGERDNHGGRWGPGIFHKFYTNFNTSQNTTEIQSENTTEIQTQRPTENQPPPQEYDFRRNDREPVPKSLDTIDFFIIMADKDGNYLSIHNNDDLSQENSQKYIDAILEKGITGGMLNNYQFLSAEKSNGTIFVFTDKTAEMNMLSKLKRTTIIIGLASILLLSVASYFLSGLIVKPIKEAFDKQKQFISDASHELKTPLTVISTNADVLSGEIGCNKWLGYICDQADRMNVLVNELLNLTRLENNTSNFVLTDFDLSKAVENTALPFECQAFETNKNFVLNIEKDIHITASEQHIKQMTAIFIDNALKYSKDGGTVRVSLTKEDKKIQLSVFNTGTGLKESDKDKIFERFYRSDESRNRAAGSYGLGLAIAKSIIDKHKYKINIENVEGTSVCFNIIMHNS